MRSMILTAAALTVLMLVPHTAQAFETEGVNPDSGSTAHFSDQDKAPIEGGLQGLGQTDPTHFSDFGRIVRSTRNHEAFWGSAANFRRREPTHWKRRRQYSRSASFFRFDPVFEPLYPPHPLRPKATRL